MTASDVIFVVVFVFSIALALFVLNFTMGTAVDQIINNTGVNSSVASTAAFEGIKTTTARFDWLVIGVYIGLLIAMIATSWFIAGNPMFMLIYFIVTVLGVLVSALLANTWETLTQSSVFGTTVANFPMTNHLISLFPFYVAIMGFVGFVIMFAKPQGNI